MPVVVRWSFLPAAVLGILLALTPGLRSVSHAGKRPAGVLAHHHQPGILSRRVIRRRVPEPRGAAQTTLAYPPPPIAARAAYLIDLGTGRILFSKNPDTRLPVASTTKITTAALVLALSRLSAMVTVSQNAATIGESTMSLRRGERLTVLQLLYGMLLNSGNDAAIALAEHVGGTEARFVRMMNRLAHDLGMRNTHYQTPHGLDAPHQYSSARDLATIAIYAMRDPTFRRIVATTSYHIPATRHNAEHWLGNINRVMYWYPGVDGVKPGGTDAAGLCQVVSDWRNGHHLLAVLLNTPTLVTDIRNLLDYGSRDFAWVQAPAYWDVPWTRISGGSGSRDWAYYLGAGHYIRGLFLRYFDRHDGLRVLGYPRTEVLRLGGRWVQFFQGGELVEDRGRRAVFLRALGSTLAPRSRARVARPPVVTPGFAGAYAGFGGKRVLGDPVSATTRVAGFTLQYFRNGVIAEVAGTPALVPLGDIALRARGWLPVPGAATAYPPSLAPAVVPLLR